MKKSIFLVIALIVLVMAGAVVLSKFRQSIDSALSSVPQSNSDLSPTPTFTQAKTNSKTLFVPYWGMEKSDGGVEEYDELVYFGVAANKDGLIKEEQGHKNINGFLSLAEDKKKHLTIRMIDSETNFAILKDKEAQKLIIQESVSLAREHDFDGVILNLELSALPFDSLLVQIRDFNKIFYEQVKANNLEYGMTAYGDTFFRVRPFDIEEIAKNTDRLYIMAYDFHKAKGNPGPNFPLKGGEDYGYDLETMVDGFLQYLPPEKITIIFGLYGYDWKVDSKNISQELAKPLSLLEARQRLVNDCAYDSCNWQRDNTSGEIKAEYTKSGEKHTVWFEDMESVKRKTEFLSSRGIGTVAYWAYSYF